MVQILTKSCPRVRGKWYGEAMTKGRMTQSAQVFFLFPLSLTSFDSSPASGGAFWLSAPYFLPNSLWNSLESGLYTTNVTSEFMPALAELNATKLHITLHMSPCASA